MTLPDPRSLLVGVLALACAGLLGVGIAVACRRAIAAHDAPLDSARRAFRLSMRRIADALGLALATVVLLIGSSPELVSPDVGGFLVVVAAATAAAAVIGLARGVATPWIPSVAADGLVAGLLIAERYESLKGLFSPLAAVSFPVGGQRVTLLGVLTSLITILVLYAAARFAFRVSRVLIRRREGWDEAQKALAEKLLAIGTVAVVIVIGIDVAGLGGTMVALFSGTLGLGIGFGLRSIFSNLVSGLLLLIDRSVKPGDTIAVDDTVGEVISVGVRAVAVSTRDDKVYLIPNEILITDTVQNWGFSSHEVRERVAVTVAMDSDLDLVEQILLDAALGAPRVLSSPAPAVRITELTSNGIHHELRFWISDPEQGRANVKHVVYRRLLGALNDHQIRLPAPGVEISREPDRAFDD